MRHTSVLCALSLLAPLTVASAASAQDPGRRSEVEVMDFVDGDEVTGEFQTPMVDRLSSIRRGRRTTLIRPREHFRTEMLKSVENL